MRVSVQTPLQYRQDFCANVKAACALAKRNDTARLLTSGACCWASGELRQETLFRPARAVDNGGRNQGGLILALYIDSRIGNPGEVTRNAVRLQGPRTEYISLQCSCCDGLISGSQTHAMLQASVAGLPSLRSIGPGSAQPTPFEVVGMKWPDLCCWYTGLGIQQ